tara:strand:- start:936 stop:1133 length:198 start_codon:yes stop_codon:yes gene_type:complete
MTSSEYRNLRHKIGSQSEVAKQLGVDKMTISNRERGVYSISREAKLALVYLMTCKTAGLGAYSGE